MDEFERFQRLGELTFSNWGRIAGLDMMLRSLLAKWALEHDDPQAFLDDFADSLINGLAKQGRDDDPVEATMLPHAE